MLIGIDLVWLVPNLGGGMDSHVRGLLGGLSKIDEENQYVLYTTRANHGSFEALPSNFKRVLLQGISTSLPSRLFGEQITLGWHLSRRPPDVLHSPGFTMPLLVSVPRVFTVHDLKVYALPSLYPTSRRILRKYFVKEAIRRADAIISVSDFTRQDIVQRFGIPCDRISIVYNAVDNCLPVINGGWPELANRLRIRSEYVVVFSAREDHKNVGALIRAYARPGVAEHTQLVVVGHLPDGPTPLRELVASLRMEGRIVFTGYLSEKERNMVLAHARLLAFPSLYEGFGIVLLEAMASSIPIACSGTTALPEVAGQAAVFFDPLSVDEIAAAVQRLLGDESLRRRLINAGRERAQGFSWTESARKTLKVYKSVYNSSLV